MSNKNKVEELENLKQKKLMEILGIEEKIEKKKVNYKKISKTIFKIFLFFCELFLIFLTVFLASKYIEFQRYLKETQSVIELGEKYQQELDKEEERKEAELKNLKNLNLENINNLPLEKKELMLNIVPNGNPSRKTIKITSPFGIRIHPVTGMRKMHTGIDLKVNIGDDIVSTAMGKVVFAGTKNGYGKTVIVDHNYGFQTLYAHLDKIYVKVGDIVGKGKVIAAGGNTGVSTGSHLHYEVNYNGVHINPKNFIDWNKKNFNIIFKKEEKIPWESFLTIMGKN